MWVGSAGPWVLKTRGAARVRGTSWALPCPRSSPCAQSVKVQGPPEGNSGNPCTLQSGKQCLTWKPEKSQKRCYCASEDNKTVFPYAVACDLQECKVSSCLNTHGLTRRPKEYMCLKRCRSGSGQGALAPLPTHLPGPTLQVRRVAALAKHIRWLAVARGRRSELPGPAFTFLRGGPQLHPQGTSARADSWVRALLPKRTSPRPPRSPAFAPLPSPPFPSPLFRSTQMLLFCVAHTRHGSGSPSLMVAVTRRCGRGSDYQTPVPWPWISAAALFRSFFYCFPCLEVPPPV